MLITNDPWLGSTHLPDYNVVTPMFRNGKIVAFLGTVAHVSDVGGHLGDLEAYDVFMEGIRILPAKFFRAGEPNEELIEIIAANCRVPENVLGDLQAIVGTHRMAIRQLHEFMDDYGLGDLQLLAREIKDRSETALRRAIEALPDGVYRDEVTGDGYLKPFTLKVAITISGSEMPSISPAAPQQQWDAAINAAFNMTYATSVYPIKCMLVPHVPNNDGLVRPLAVVAPEGSIVNCTFPAPVKARAKVMKHIPPLIFGALAPLLPEETIAAAGGIFPFISMVTTRVSGASTSTYCRTAEWAPWPSSDGHPPVAYPHNSTVTPAEMMELRSPVLMLRKSPDLDSGGPGRRRGGLGVEYVLSA